MIIGRTLYTVPMRRRAERFEVVVSDRIDASRIAFRPVYCPCCRAHRTLVLDAWDWQPHPGVKHVECGSCGGRGADGRGSVQ